MVAAIAGDVEFVRLLIAAGADVMVTDTRGRTALDYAALGKRPENREAIAELLREAMAKQAGR
jgi:ankyrin repeat protein